jgi:hypothetical protein
VIAVALAALAALAVGAATEPLFGWFAFADAPPRDPVLPPEAHARARPLAGARRFGRSAAGVRLLGRAACAPAPLAARVHAPRGRAGACAQALGGGSAGAAGGRGHPRGRPHRLAERRRAGASRDRRAGHGPPITHLVRIPAFAQYLEGGDFSRP